MFFLIFTSYDSLLASGESGTNVSKKLLSSVQFARHDTKLFSDDQCRHRWLTGENTTELALELTTLASAVGLDAISTCNVTYALNDPLNKKGASGSKWVVLLLQAADRHTETADSEVWGRVRTQCSFWLNQCSWSNCSDSAERAGASVRCRMALWHIERLSHESRMRLLNDLPQERPADCPGAQHVCVLLVRQPSSHSASLVAAAHSASWVAAAHSASLVAAAHSASLVAAAAHSSFLVFSAHSSSARLNSFQLCRLQKEIVKLETILDGQWYHWPLELVVSIWEIDHLLEQSAAVEPSMQDKLNDILRDWDIQSNKQ